MIAVCSPLVSPRMIGRTPNAGIARVRRLASADLPTPGWPSRNMPVLVTSPAAIHANGSRHTVSPHRACGPSGTPAVGAPDPARNGYSPAAWVVVAT